MPVNGSHRLYAALLASGAADTTMVTFPGHGHQESSLLADVSLVSQVCYYCQTSRRLLAQSTALPQSTALLIADIPLRHRTG